MKLVMTLLVRDEEEMLAANLDYHLAQGVDFVIATDHGSADATPEILRDYEARRLARVLRVDGREHHQSRRVTRMARMAAIEYGADWVINNDADEFWWPVVGSLKDVLTAVPERYGQIVSERNNFMPVEVGSGEAFYERLLVRERRSLNLHGEPLEPKVAHRGHPGVRVKPGNHGIEWVGLWPTPEAVPLLEVLHFPMRSFEQFEQKVLHTGIGYESLQYRSEEVGRDQLRLLELQRCGELRAWYEERLLSPGAVQQGLRGGTLVIDDRLAEFMRGPGDRSARELVHLGGRPESEAARRLVACALSDQAAPGHADPNAQ